MERKTTNPQQRKQTGYKDRKGREIREGDIVKVIKLGVVYIVKGNETWSEVTDGTLRYSEIIGNIYDNPDLTERIRLQKK